MIRINTIIRFNIIRFGRRPAAHLKKLSVMSIRILTIVSLVWLSVCGFSQQAWGAPQGKGEREQWMTEMRQYKRIYLTKELELSREQQNKFYPLYEEMEDQEAKINDEARMMEKRVADLPNATDLEYEKATEAIYDAAVRSAELEKEYMGKFADILSRKQLFRLKSVERQFNREMMKQHHRLRKGRGADK